MFKKYQLTLALALLTWFALSYPLQPLKGLGPMLNPFTGVWRHKPPQVAELSKLADLQESVEVLLDDFGVPHVIAQNQADLFLVQGWWVASQRLFQMDLLSRPGGASLSELVGPVALDYDRFFALLGQRQSSRLALDSVLADPETRLAVEQFSKGVNAYLSQLKPHEWPPEYALLGVQPQKWTPLKTAQFLKTMSFNLAGRSYDLYLTRHLQNLGREKVEELFPNRLPWQDSERFVLPISQHARPTPSEIHSKAPPEFKDFVSEIKEWPKFLQPFATNGSNNFAVGPQKSTSGVSILANDTHLGLTLPSTWFEMHLMAPGYEVYGGSFPAGPGVILGFNSQLAWGVTNGTSDVADWYELEFRDETSTDYLLDGVWTEAEVFNETLKIKGGGSEDISVIKTAFGFVMHREGRRGLAVDWTAHRPANELKAFLDLGKAKTMDACHQAIQSYKTPSQNFLCVTQSEISLTHQGLFPRREEGQGKYVMPALSQNRWQEWMNSSELPHLKNPEQGFLRSANNMVLDNYESWLGWDYDESYRARRIDEVLLATEKLSPEDLINLQNDQKDLFAAEVLPVLLGQLDQSKMNKTHQTVYEALTNWDFKAQADGIEATVFDAWWTEFEKQLYEPILGPREHNYYPRRQWTEGLLRACEQDFSNSICHWLQVSEIEKAAGSVLAHRSQASWEKALQALEQTRGPIGERWRWGLARPTELRHVARIPGLGSGQLEMGGTRYSPNANHGAQGATWKLVVEMTSPPKAWTMINGGSSGHPFSSDYQRFVDDWRRGEMKQVLLDVEALRRDADQVRIYRFEPLFERGGS